MLDMLDDMEVRGIDGDINLDTPELLFPTVSPPLSLILPEMPPFPSPFVLAPLESPTEEEVTLPPPPNLGGRLQTAVRGLSFPSPSPFPCPSPFSLPSASPLSCPALSPQTVLQQCTVTTKEPSKKLFEVPKSVTEHFDNVALRSTRRNPIPDGKSKVKAKKATKPKDMTEEQRKAVAEVVKAGKLGRGVLNRYLGVSKFDVYHLKKRNRRIGRPKSISEEGQQRIYQAVERAEMEQQALTSSDVLELLKTEIKATCEATGKKPPSAFSIEKNKARYMKLAGVFENVGQVTTEARWVAGRDVRNMVTMASMLYLFKDNPPQLFANLDSTRHHVTFDNNEKLVTTGKCRKENLPLTKTGVCSLGVATKQYTLISASGHNSLTYLLSDNSLNDEDFFHFTVSGLAISSADPIFPTEICLCKSKSGNKKFFEYLFTVVVVKFADESRQLVSSKQQSLPFLLLLDGEAIQSEVLQQPHVLRILVEHNITVGKGPASTSGSCGNPADMGNFFKSQKTLLKAAPLIDSEYDGPMERLMTKMNECDEKLRKIPKEKKQTMAAAVARVVVSSRKILNPSSTISQGFSLLGLHPHNILVTLQCCKQDRIAKAENVLSFIASKIPILSEFIRDTGQITEEQMDKENIPISEDPESDKQPKHLRVQERQRAIVITHAMAVQRRQEYLKKREDEANAIEQRKVEKQNEKIQKEKEKEELKLQKAKEKEEQKIKKEKEKEEKKKLVEEAKENKKRKREEEEAKKKEKEKEKDKEKEKEEQPRRKKSKEFEVDERAEILSHLDLLFGMMGHGEPTDTDNVVVSSPEILRNFINQCELKRPIKLEKKSLTDKQFWHDVIFEVNSSNLPKCFAIPGEVMNPMDSLTPTKRKAVEALINSPRSQKDNSDIITTCWISHKLVQFKIPVPVLMEEEFNPVHTPTVYEALNSQVLQHGPRICRGHMDHGFGYLHLVKGTKIFIYVEEVEREVGSSVDPVPGCSLKAAWDLDVLLQHKEHVKYFFLKPGHFVLLPASTKHIVCSLTDCFAHGGFTSHLVSSINDLAHRLDMHRETHPDLATNDDVQYAESTRVLINLTKKIKETIDDADLMTIKRVKEIIQLRRASFVHSNDSLQRQLTNLVKIADK